MMSLCAVMTFKALGQDETQAPRVRTVPEEPEQDEPKAWSVIQAGPMVGYVAPDSARIWIQVEEGAKLTATAEQGEGIIDPTRIEALGNGIHLIHFEDLKPETHSVVIVGARQGRDPIAYDKLSFKTAPLPSATGRVRIAFSSCSQDSRYGKVPGFEAMAAVNPDAALFVGDNSYFVVGDGNWDTTGESGDWDTAELMRARHMKTRRNSDLQSLIRKTPCYAVWDDHDYGPDNSDRDLPTKDAALEVFKQMWANPSYGTEQTPGVFSSFRLGPAEIFLMDGRYYKYVSTEKHPDVAPEDAVIWGKDQTQWLLDRLKASTAPVKIIANGTQCISEHPSPEGHRQEAPKELETVLAFLKENKIGGVVFLTGDRHHSEMMRLEQTDGPDILEFTSSPIQQDQKIGPLERKHATRLWGMVGNSYGLVTIDIPEEGKGTIRFEARDEKNKVPIIQGLRCVTTWDISKLTY